MMREKVVVGMSGGVDSSVAAMLLRNAGYDVIGVTLLLTPDGNTAGAEDAALVAKKLDIEHRTLDLRACFQEKVIDYFADEYLCGATPNPCIRCNREIKFGKMLEFAHTLGCEKVATGHYARIEHRDGRHFLMRTDSAKDQSYFLCMLRQDQLACAVFPICGMDKTDLRKLAADAGLPVAQKKDSQDVCFIPDNDYVSYICRCRNITPMAGDFVDCDGNILGKHEGILRYTIGQRKGLGAFGKPMFVTAIDARNGRVILGENGKQYAAGLRASSLNWIAFDEPPKEFECTVKIRFRAQPCQALVRVDGESADVRFDTPQRSVTPGQTIAFYSGDTVLGGGRIDSAIQGE